MSESPVLPGEIVCILALASFFLTHKKPVGVPLVSLPNIKSESQVRYLTALTRHAASKSHAWIMKS